MNDPITNRYISIIYNTIFCPPSDTFRENQGGAYNEVYALDEGELSQKISLEFIKRFAPALNAAAKHSLSETYMKQSDKK